MEHIEPYLQSLSVITKQLSQHTYFHQVAIVMILITSFCYGHFTHEKKLTHLIDMVNDAQNTRKLISQRLANVTASNQSMKNKKKFLVFATVLICLLNLGWYYLTKIFDLQLIVISVLIVFFMWIIYVLRSRYLRWQKRRLQTQLKNTNMTADTEIKQILGILGKSIEDKLKNMYQNQVDLNWAKQAQQHCKLYKCYNQKKVYNELFVLYETIYNQIKKNNLCQICLTQNNISTQQLALSEFENSLRFYNKTISSLNRLTTQQKKQLVNRMLKEYQVMDAKLARVCKRGCCIKQRNLIETAKNKHYEKLKRLLSSL